MDKKIPEDAHNIFEKIINGVIPTEIHYRDEKCIVFSDINPIAPVHLLIVPVMKIIGISTANEEDINILGHLMLICRKMSEQFKLEKGFRIVINNGEDGGQTVMHLHVHLLGKRQMSWPPG